MVPVGAQNFSEAVQMMCEVYQVLKGILKKKYGLAATGVGDEGGFAPELKSAEEGLVVLIEAIQKAGYEGRVKLAMDVAASGMLELISVTFLRGDHANSIIRRIVHQRQVI
jgi:enolase